MMMVINPYGYSACVMFLVPSVAILFPIESALVDVMHCIFCYFYVVHIFTGNSFEPGLNFVLPTNL